MLFREYCPYWLRRIAKDLPVPDIVWMPRLNNAAATYYRPTYRLPLDWVESTSSVFHSTIDWCSDTNRRYLSFKRGMILLSQEVISRRPYPERNLGSTLAHEWCHHWQLYNRRRAKPPRLNTEIPYPDAIREYFQSPKEAEALRFQLRVSSTEEVRHRAAMVGWNTRSTGYFIPSDSLLGNMLNTFPEVYAELVKTA